MLLLPVLLAGCNRGVLQKRAINASFDVKVTDPDIKQLTDVTSKIDIVASGEFTPGTYLINNKSVQFEPDTTFKLQLTLPIDDPAIIHTRYATGSLWTSKQLHINGIPMPQTVELSSGQVSGEVDLIRSLGAFFIACLQKSGDVGDVHQIAQSLRIEEAKLDLRPDSILNLDMQKIHIGSASTIELKDVSVDHEFNYDGICQLHLSFLPGCQWTTQRAQCEFDGGGADLEFHASKTRDRLSLNLTKVRNSQQIVLQHSVYRFGKNRRSSAQSDSCLINPKKLEWVYASNANHPRVHMVASMEPNASMVDLKSDVQETIAKLPDMVPATIEIDEVPSGLISTQFATAEPTDADSVRIVMAKKATSLTVALTDAEVGPISIDKSGALHFSFERGTAHLKQLVWQGNKSKFTLTPSGGADVSVPEGMLLERGNGNAHTKLSMPLDVNLGTATIVGARGSTTLTDLKGKLNIDVDREIEIIGNLDFHIPRSKLLGGQAIDITAHGLNISVAQGAANLELKNCTVMVPQGAIQDAINKKVPDSLTLQLNKMVSEDEQWRYRHALAQTATVNNLQLMRMKPQPPNSVSFNAVGDVDIIGTVEQSNATSADEKTASWEIHPWKLSGHIDGQGLVSYKFVTQGPHANEIQYSLALDLPVPKDVQLDWSQVAHGVLGFVERKVIVHHLRKITIPIKYQGSVPIFPEDNQLARNFKVQGLVAKHTDDATELDFSATARF